MALAAIGWADGKLASDEADAIVRMAADEGLEIEEIAEIEERAKTPINISDLDLSSLPKEERLFVYAVGAWIARVDGMVAPQEITALNQLAAALKLPDKPREYADTIAIEVGKLSESDKPAFYNLHKLRKTLRVRLAEARKLREAQED